MILLLLLLLLACGRDAADRPAASREDRAAARTDSVVRQPVYPEAEAVQILRAINAHAIATARVARERTQNLDIMRYAGVMIADHTAMTELLDSLIAPVPDSANEVSRALREETSAFVDTLWALPAGFNNTYIQSQIAAHEHALQLLDTAIIPSARNPQLRQLLQDLRPAVVAHLQRARQIWAERQASGLAAATARATPAQTPAQTRTPAQTQTQPPPQTQPPAPRNEPAARRDTGLVQPPPPPTTMTND